MKWLKSSYTHEMLHLANLKFVGGIVDTITQFVGVRVCLSLNQLDGQKIDSPLLGVTTTWLRPPLLAIIVLVPPCICIGFV